MALFQKKPQVQSSAPLYSIGAHKTILIIGLGNPGKEYEGTRHNVGFAVLDKFAQDNEFPGWAAKKDLKCQLVAHNLGENRVILCKPTTFMNNSGEAAQAVQRFYQIYNKNTLAIYDELAIPFGSLRTRLGGSDAGHNGVKSLIQHIGEDFGRLRIGVGSDISQKADAAEFVLGKFTKKEQEDLPQITREAGAIITEFIFGGELPHQTRTVL
ncbi:MAG TPA: aminoacyl-tRNA hydrolase [Candidatus Saccharimonadales bacterium]|nr:aminoacyl-tRNA hydrolase [Candidatus Saccharimonadales bacterium]